VSTAMGAPMPDPSTATDDVFCEDTPETLGSGAAPWSGFSVPIPASAAA
jgi:hypothetical protein